MWVHTNLEYRRPTEEQLRLCHEVIIAEPAFLMWQMKRFCRERELSLVWAELVDTADVSPEYDRVAAFYFIQAQDATLFRLQYK